MARLRIELDISEHWINPLSVTVRDLATRLGEEGLPEGGGWLVRDADGDLIGRAEVVAEDAQPAKSKVVVDAEGVMLKESFSDGVRLQDVSNGSNMRMLYLRLVQGTMPVNTLRGEAHVDVASDGRVLGATIEMFS